MNVNRSTHVSTPMPVVNVTPENYRFLMETEPLSNILEISSSLTLKDFAYSKNYISTLEILNKRLEGVSPYEYLKHLDHDELCKYWIDCVFKEVLRAIDVCRGFKLYLVDKNSAINSSVVSNEDFLRFINIITGCDQVLGREFLEYYSDASYSDILKKSFDLHKALDGSDFSKRKEILTSAEKIERGVRFKCSLFSQIFSKFDLDDDFLKELGRKISLNEPGLALHRIIENYDFYERHYKMLFTMFSHLSPKKVAEEIFLRFSSYKEKHFLLRTIKDLRDTFEGYKLDVNPCIHDFKMTDKEVVKIFSAAKTSPDEIARFCIDEKRYHLVPNNVSTSLIYELFEYSCCDSSLFHLVRALYERRELDTSMIDEDCDQIEILYEILSPQDRDIKNRLDAAILKYYVQLGATDVTQIKILVFSELEVGELLFIRDEDFAKYLKRFNDEFDRVKKTRSLDMILKLGFRNFRWTQPMESRSYTRSQVKDIHTMMRSIFENVTSLTLDYARKVIEKCKKLPSVNIDEITQIAISNLRSSVLD